MRKAHPVVRGTAIVALVIVLWSALPRAAIPAAIPSAPFAPAGPEPSTHSAVPAGPPSPPSPPHLALAVRASPTEVAVDGVVTFTVRLADEMLAEALALYEQDLVWEE